MDRIAKVERSTLETQISVEVNLDGVGKSDISTGIGFFDHMLDQVARHGLFDLSIKAEGDLHIDIHHTVEDIGITLGQAFAKALPDKKGTFRYGYCYVPLDEALSRVVVDLSGRPGLEYSVNYVRGRIGDFDVDVIREFFQGFVNQAKVTLHIDNLKGINAHHQAETVFKAFGRALRMAVAVDVRSGGALPSTKGQL
ncbi:MAG: imidazoleglycerol-phosphate dehydratase HisB [Proteobacteria bacterium]|nr:imidazoleglycerol-phosphate dehydratase HisB [Pseudomonadota bacterium]MDA1332275.1 imidazoleglycerol-phosphate dehydratase HisB [Pseudomonadota bacterium]